MSREYAERRIREALSLHKGNATRTRQQVMAWTYEDPKLLQALAQPHLTGIIAHAVNRVIHANPLDDEPVEQVLAEQPQRLDMDPETFGQEILKALSSSSTAVFGRESSGAPTGRKKASKSHIDALRMMAERKKPDPDE